MSGPTTDAMPKMAPKRPWNKGLFASGIVWTITTTPPEKMPEQPNPAIDRPHMKATEFGAAPQIVDPISKSRMAERKTHLVG